MASAQQPTGSLQECDRAKAAEEQELIAKRARSNYENESAKAEHYVRLIKHKCKTCGTGLQSHWPKSLEAAFGHDWRPTEGLSANGCGSQYVYCPTTKSCECVFCKINYLEQRLERSDQQIEELEHALEASDKKVEELEKKLLLATLQGNPVQQPIPSKVVQWLEKPPGIQGPVQVSQQVSMTKTCTAVFQMTDDEDLPKRKPGEPRSRPPSWEEEYELCQTAEVECDTELDHLTDGMAMLTTVKKRKARHGQITVSSHSRMEWRRGSAESGACLPL